MVAMTSCFTRRLRWSNWRGGVFDSLELRDTGTEYSGKSIAYDPSGIAFIFWNMERRWKGG